MSKGHYSAHVKSHTNVTWCDACVHFSLKGKLSRRRASRAERQCRAVKHTLTSALRNLSWTFSELCRNFKNLALYPAHWLYCNGNWLKSFAWTKWVSEGSLNCGVDEHIQCQHAYVMYEYVTKSRHTTSHHTTFKKSRSLSLWSSIC